MSSEEKDAAGTAVKAPTDEARHSTRVVGLRPLAKPRIAKFTSSESALGQIIQLVTKKLPQLASDGLWDHVLRATRFLLWLTHHVPGAAAFFIAAKGTARVQDVVHAAAGNSSPAAVTVLQPATALLLVCVQTSESAADLVVESQSVRLLLQLLTRHDVGASTKRHTGDILQALAAAKLVYRDVLHGAGVVDALMSAFTDASVIADLLLLQKLLWVLISLSDDDVVYKADMREAGLPAAMVALFSVYQANQGAAELRPVAAQILRCLHLMAHDDQQMRLMCQRLGLIPFLVNQLHLDIHQMDEPPLPAAAANVLNLNSMPTTPRSPVKAASSSGAGAGSPFTPSSPLRRTGSSGSGNSSPRAVSGAGGRRSSALEPPIPEETEMEELDLPDSPTAAAAAASGSSSLYPGSLGLSFGGRSAGFPHSSEAAALRGLGAGPSVVTRVAAAVLLREVLAGVMSNRSMEVLLHGMLLPACHMQLVGPRLSLALEATSTLLALLTDNTDNQAAAVKAGAIPLLVQLLSVRNIDLASTAAEVITLIASSGVGAAVSGSGSAGCLGSYTAAAVGGLADLLKECAAHAYALGLGRHRSTPARVDGRVSIDWRSTDRDHSLSPVQEAMEAVDAGGRSSNATSTTVGLGLLGTTWSSDKQHQHQRSLANQGSLVFRHPSLSRDVATGSIQQQQHQPHPEPGIAKQHEFNGSSTPPITRRQLSLSLSTRDRISSSSSVGVNGGHCLVNSHEAHESCGFCPLSSTVIALCTLLSPVPQLQQQALAAGCVEVLVGLLAGEVCHVADHSRLLGALAQLTALAVQGNAQAQDQVRQAGGIDIVSEALERVATSATAAAAASVPEDVLQLAVNLLQLLTALVSGNSANKLCVREAGVFSGVASLLDTVLKLSGSGLEVLSQALLQLLIASLQESPGCQAEACQQGVTGKLLNLLRLPANDYTLGYLTIQALGLLANKAQHAALAEVTAGGVVSVVMNVLQQQAMTGVLVSEVCMTVLPGLLDGNPAGKTQALGYGVLPLLVHLLRSSPSSTTVSAAAQTIAVLADRNTELQGQIISAGGLHALLDKLDPANAAAAAANAAAAQAAAAAANAAAEAAAAALAKVAGDANSSAGGADASAAAAADSSGEQAADAVPAADSSSQQHHLHLPNAAASILQAAADSDAAGGGSADKQQQQQQQMQQQARGLMPEQLALLEAQQKLAQVKVRIACLEAVAALSHDNMFSKNTARQQGIMPLMVDLLAQGKCALQKSAASAVASRQQQQQQQQQASADAGAPNGGNVQHGPLRVRTPRSSQQQQQQQVVMTSPEQVLEQRTQAAHMHVLITAVQVLKEICHGAHSNQQAAAAEGLIDQLTSLAALALGSSLEEAASHRLLLAAVADALSAVCEFCHPNQLVARDCGGVEVLSRVILMAAEAPNMSVLCSLRLHSALASCCGAVVALAQDCDEDQRSFTSHPDFLPALFRLMSVDDPGLATQAARALEFIAIRNDYADDADDRPEFEADTVMALIRTLAHGAIAISGSGRAAVARVAVGGAVGTPPAAVIREAADLLAQVAEAAQTAGSMAALTPAGSSAAPSRTVSGLGTAPAHPSAPPIASSSARQLQAATSVKQRQQQQVGAAAAAPAAAGPGPGPGAGVQDADLVSPRPAALLPAVVTDHTSGLAVLRTWSMQEDVGGMWQALVARIAPAFQPITAAVPEGPWKPFKVQIAWMLLLLATKSPDNGAIVSRVQRTTLLPLAMQLENAERFYQQAAEVEAAAQVAAAAARRGVAGTSSTEVTASAASSRRSTGRGLNAVEAELIGAVSTSADTTVTSIAAAPESDRVPVAANSNGAPGQPTGLEDDELSMLQAEVAFLGLMSSNNSSQKESGAGL